MSYGIPVVWVSTDGSHDVLTLRDNGKTLETRRVPVWWGPGGVAQAPSLEAERMVHEHSNFGPAYTVMWEGRGFSIHLTNSR